jgi:hypothetical protein
VLDKLFGTTRGSVMFRGPAAWLALGPGNIGQFLKTQGDSADLTWATPPGASPTMTFAAASEIDGDVLLIRTAGRDVVGDDGDGTYRRAPSMPGHLGRFRSQDRFLPNGSVSASDGGWWELVGARQKAKQYGVRADGTTDDTAAAQAFINGPAQILEWPPGTIVLGAAGLVGRSNQVWQGAGQGVTIFKANANPAADLISFPNRTNYQVLDLTIDWNNKTPAGNNGALVVNGSNFAVRRCSIIHIGLFGLIGSNCSDNWVIEQNYIQRDTASSTANQAILLTAAGGENLNGIVTQNRLVNSALDASCRHCQITFNRIDGWGYGAGLTFEADVHTSTNVIFGNVLTGGRSLADSNGYFPGGIENWGSDSVIGGNIAAFNGGAGIDHGGARSAVVGNVCIANGQKAGGAPGITARFLSSTYQQAFSTYVGNVSRDIGGLTQTHGIKADAGNPTYISAYGNSLNGGTLPADIGSGNFRSFDGPHLEGGTSTGPQTIANGASSAVSLSVPGANLGDKVSAALAIDLQGVTLSAYVSAANSVIVVFANSTGGSRTLAGASLSVTVTKGSNAANY